MHDPSHYIPPLASNSIGIFEYNGSYILEFSFAPTYDGADHEGGLPHTRILLDKDMLNALKSMLAGLEP